MAPTAKLPRIRTATLTCYFSVELRGFEPLTPSMPWRCATSCATAPRDPGTDEPGPEGPDIGGPHQHREEILPCCVSDFDLIAEHVVFRPAHALRLVVLGWLDAQTCPAIRDIGDRNEVYDIGVGAVHAEVIDVITVRSPTSCPGTRLMSGSTLPRSSSCLSCTAPGAAPRSGRRRGRTDSRPRRAAAAGGPPGAKQTARRPWSYCQ